MSLWRHLRPILSNLNNLKESYALVSDNQIDVQDYTERLGSICLQILDMSL